MGSFADNTVRIATLNATNDQGISLTGSGTVPLSGGLNVRVDGNAPLGLGEAFLASRGTQLAGTGARERDRYRFHRRPSIRRARFPERRDDLRSAFQPASE